MLDLALSVMLAKSDVVPRISVPCWMVNESGQVIDMSSICPSAVPVQAEPSAQVIDPNRPESDGTVGVVVSGLRLEGDRLLGTVINQTGQPVYDVRVSVDLYDRRGDLTGVPLALIDANPIAPGGTATFDLRTFGNPFRAEVNQVIWTF